VPDEHSNLNLPSSARRPSARPAGRRRGRRGGRGRPRAPRPPGEKPDVAAEELAPTPEAAEPGMVHDAAVEPETEADTSGGFREPHPEEPGDAMPPEEMSHSHAERLSEAAPEPPVEMPPVQEPERERERERRPERQERPDRQERPARPEYRRPEPKPWVKPADFRPAEISAISQAVAHATEIAESLKHTIDQLDEILELVELAERQKLADEREIDELRRALRRIQPPRFQQQAPRGPRHEDSHRGGHREHHPRPDERHQRHEETRPPEAGEPPPHVD